MTPIPATVAAFLAFSATVPGPQDPARQVLQVHAKELWTEDGERVQEGVLVVVDGRIRSIGSASDLDPRQPILRHEGVVTAGLIACQASGGAAGELHDPTRSVLPAARAVLAFDPDHPDFERARAAGITALVLAPGGENLVGGLTCVVKTAGGRVLEDEAALALSFSGSALGLSTAQSSFFFGASDAEELQTQAAGGPEVPGLSRRGTREPTSYSGALALLERLFASGREPFSRAKKGELAVVLEAFDRHEVVRAARFAQEHRLKGAIRGVPLAGDPDVVAALLESGLGVILGPSGSSQTVRSLASLAALGQAGVPAAFALGEHAPEELRLFAARALWAGAARDVVWKALTSDAARLAGAASAIGRLAPGFDADFVFWSGDPLDLSSRSVAVYVDGKLSWSAPPAPSSR